MRSLALLTLVLAPLACGGNGEVAARSDSAAASAVGSTLRDFGLRGTVAFFYYKDLPKAVAFYRDILGLEEVADYGMARIVRVSEGSFLVLVDATKGMHTAAEPKTVAIALHTENLREWHDWLASKGYSPRRPFVERDSSAHDGFVIPDPEGYLLEFERFNEHPENTRFLPYLQQYPVVRAPNSPLPAILGFNATVLWLYYKDLPAMQTFWEEVMGLRLIVDQGWAKIYEAAGTGYIGLVDEQRGMHKWTATKAVNVGFLVDSLDAWFRVVRDRQRFALRDSSVAVDSAGRYRAFVGYDPEGYFLEFDTFLEHPVNTRLLSSLQTRGTR